ncbi:rod shape-determining protein [Nonomuraea dietziae]|uniref:rod shape-determining protein n=1 Tax=Nonomuraea dietziae TaxID=65515 RepID=UPI0034315C32
MLTFLGRDLAIDLGTATTLIHVRGRGIMVNEPSVVALDTSTGRIVAYGSEARRPPAGSVTVRPVRNGVIVEPDIARRMLRYFVRKVHGHPFARPRMTIAVPGGITSIERKVAWEAAYEAEARRITFMENTLAAAFGAGLGTGDPIAAMVVDIGGGTTDVAAVSLGAVVAGVSRRAGGEEMDQAIKAVVRRLYGLEIDDRTAETLKKEIGGAGAPPRHRGLRVSGIDPDTGRTAYATISAVHVHEAIDPTVRTIIDAVRRVLESCSPEIATDVARRGLFLAGGGALLSGLPARLGTELGIPVSRVERPEHSVALGLSMWSAASRAPQA